MLSIRSATSVDAATIAELLARYMAEALGRAWEGATANLARDIAAGTVDVAVAVEGAERIVGFAAWHPTYDVHHCAVGGEISDMFMLRAHRGKGAAALLIAHVASEVERRGGRYVKGRGIEAGGGLYHRLAVVCDGEECYVGGAAFRAIASLAGASPRQLAAGLPDRSLNFEQ
jgi:GNAT superfamily N-acetyltransferase